MLYLTLVEFFPFFDEIWIMVDHWWIEDYSVNYLQ